MKFLIIGLGTFGATLAEKLTQLGHEVIGVDKQMDKVEDIKDKITHAMCVDCKHMEAVKSLPLKNTDVVLVCIGENEGANLLTTALLKKMNVKRLISRSVSPIHETILKAMDVKEIFSPEGEAAERWAKKLTTKGVVDSIELTDDFSIIEAMVPQRFVGKTIEQIGFNKRYHVVVLTIMKGMDESHTNGTTAHALKPQMSGIATPETVLEADDIMLLYGHNDDIHNLLKD